MAQSPEFPLPNTPLALFPSLSRRTHQAKADKEAAVRRRAHDSLAVPLEPLATFSGPARRRLDARVHRAVAAHLAPRLGLGHDGPAFTHAAGGI